MTPKLKLTFKEPVVGYWDGGKKAGGEFTPELPLGLLSEYDSHPGKDYTIRWGCFDLNFWFNCGSGRSWKEAASIAKRRLCLLVKTPATVEVIW